MLTFERFDFGFIAAALPAHMDELGASGPSPVVALKATPSSDTVAQQSAQPAKRVLAELARLRYENGTLPPGTRVTVAPGGKVTINYEGRTVSFRSAHRVPFVAPAKSAVASAHLAAAATTRAKPVLERTCKCGQAFVPARHYFRSCPDCHAKAAAPVPTPVVNRVPTLDTKDLQTRFEKFAKAGFENGTLPEGITPEGTTVTKLGSQVTVSGLGFSTTFHSSKLKKLHELDRVTRERDARAARAASEAAERQVRAAKAKATAEAPKPKKDKGNKKAERAAHARAA